MALPTPPAPGPLATGLEIVGLTCRAGRRRLLDGLSLSVPQGSLTALLGPAGSGKSTLLRVLAGLVPGHGRILLDGQSVAGLPPRRRGFGVLQQPDALFPHMTLAENVAFPLRQRGVPRRNRARMAAEALALVSLDHAAGQRPHHLADGERRRAMLARATVCAPRLLLLDDIVGEQRPCEAELLLGCLRRIHRLVGTTTLLATRSGAEALAVADRIAVLGGGAVLQHGTAQTVFERPCRADIAALLGEVNRLPGRIEAVEDDLVSVRLVCGPLVEARAPDASGGPVLHTGDACLVVLRPDRIALAAVPAAEMGEGAIDARVLEQRFAGQACRLRLLIGSGTELVASRPAASGLRGLSVGAAIAIAWQPHHATALPDEGVP